MLSFQIKLKMLPGIVLQKEPDWIESLSVKSLDSVSGEVLGLVRDVVIKGEAKASKVLLRPLL